MQANIKRPQASVIVREPRRSPSRVRNQSLKPTHQTSLGAATERNGQTGRPPDDAGGGVRERLIGLSGPNSRLSVWSGFILRTPPPVLGTCRPHIGPEEEAMCGALPKEIDELKPWSQRISLGDVMTPGNWDVERQAYFLMEEAPWPVSGRILDAGANAGGIAIYLQPTADTIVCVESNVRYANQFRFISSHVDTGKIEYRRESLYKSHRLGEFSVILMLGLIYHFRYPQLFLDYCSNLKAKRFIFSTQHILGDNLILRNRKDRFGPRYNHVMMGWEPTQPAMIGMLKNAGFVVDKVVPAAWKDGFTNTLYLFCTLEQSFRTDIESISRLSEHFSTF